MNCVASLWIGGHLGWLEQMCLKSFLDHGHEVVLYSYAHVEGVPPGVRVADANEIWTPPKNLLRDTAPSYLADIFRIHLMLKSDQIWVDTDVLCLQHLEPPSEGYLFGYIPEKAEVNNAVMWLPKESQTLAHMETLVTDMSVIPTWLRPALRQRVEKLAHDERLVGRFAAKRTVVGPVAFSHYLKETGELKHALPAPVLSPVPWQFVDVLFNPHGGVDGWLHSGTRVIHLWSYMLKHHKKIPVQPTSFIGKAMARHGVAQQ